MYYSFVNSKAVCNGSGRLFHRARLQRQCVSQFGFRPPPKTTSHAPTAFPILAVSRRDCRRNVTLLLLEREGTSVGTATMPSPKPNYTIVQSLNLSTFPSRVQRRNIYHTGAKFLKFPTDPSSVRVYSRQSTLFLASKAVTGS
jgi:hypothetical protein